MVQISHYTFAPEDPTLPRWNLEKLYSSPDDPRFERDIADYERLCDDFRQTYHPRIAKRRMGDLSNAQIKDAIDAFIRPEKDHSKAYAYAMLRYELNMEDDSAEKLYLNTYLRLSEAQAKTDFFLKELAQIPPGVLERFNADETIPGKYKFFVADMVEEKRYLQNEKTERALRGQEEMLQAASEEYEKLLSGRTFTFLRNGKAEELDYSTISNIADSSSDPQARKEAWHSILEELDADRDIYAGYLRSVMIAYKEEQRIRGYKHRTTSWNRINDIPDDLPVQMAQAVHESRVVPTYMRLRGEMMGSQPLEPWDLNAPLTGMAQKHYSWAEAQDIVISAMREFHPEMGAIAERAFKENWIDAPSAVGKYPGGGFTYPGGADYPPHVLVNWHGSTSDLITLAHEVGHAVAMHVHAQHQQGFLNDTGFVEAEATALMAEQMAFAELKKRAASPLEKMIVQMEMLDNSMFYMRRAYDYEVARDLHTNFPNPNVSYSPENLDEKQLASLKRCYGDTVGHLEEAAPMWPTFCHQFSTPFYIGDYPMAALAVHTAWDKHLKKREAGGKSDLPEHFMEMLKKGGHGKGPELMKAMGVDILEKGFFTKGTDVMGRETETLRGMWEQEKDHVRKLRLEQGLSQTVTGVGPSWTSSTQSLGSSWTSRSDSINTELTRSQTGKRPGL